MDIEPLPYFVKGCVALLGDAVILILISNMT